jgi:uncharacterized protein YndB with AHSA1/START domain
MLTALTVVAITAAVAVVALLAFAATRPDTFRIERTVNIQAPPERIFPLINEFRHWGTWSPWEKMDPALKRTYSGPPGGPGAVYEWEGNRKVGKGRMEIIDAVLSSHIAIKLEFLKPFEAHNVAEFTFIPHGDATTVTWAMRGSNIFVGKVMGLFFDMDKMIGKDFENGLANLKRFAEGEALG